jgi:pyruvate/2-oxoglutarate dehydrogenase complex dihydrolipoamide dehydrogenase (E3) component
VPAYGLFIDPPLGRVGMKIWLEKQGFEVLIGHIPMTKIARAKERSRIYGAIIDAKQISF